LPATWTNAEIELLAERAYQLHLQGKHSDASIIFEGLLAIDPRNVYCLQALAALSLRLGSAQDAIQYADRALALAPDSLEALACRCEANVCLGRYSEAHQDLLRLKTMEAKTQVTRLRMRIASAEKFGFRGLPDAT
jgi:predicted Zn-dependent protease